MKFPCLKCRKNLKLRKMKLRKLHIFFFLARDTKNESKMQENLKSRKIKLGFYCIKNWRKSSLSI